jgi:hypothetical protein
MAWYRTIKTIRGRRYVYLQRTWREGKRVRTENRYVGPAGDRPAAASASVNPSEPRLAFHGSREGLDGPLRPSPGGTFGPGFYLTSARRAVRFACYDPKVAADEHEALPAGPHYTGIVYAFDMSGLNLKTVESWLAYFDLADAMLGDGKGYVTPDEQVKVQELLQRQGYDGLEVKAEREEIVIFPGSLHKLRPIATTTRKAPAEAGAAAQASKERSS